VTDREADWILQAQQGNVSAFTSLVEAYQRPVYNLCYRMLANAQDAEDAAQETFLRAFRAIHKYDNQRSFSTWILSIASHHCIDQIRRHKFNISLDELPSPDISDGDMGIETRLSRKEEQEKVGKLLKVLEPTDRAVVIIYYWNDMSLKDIGLALNLTESAVKSRLHRARRTMAQKYLEQAGPQPVLAKRMAV